MVRLVYRLNTYPLIHINLLHFLLNAFAVVPLLERFEAEHGTLLTGAFFLGRKYLISTNRFASFWLQDTAMRTYTQELV